MFCGLYVEESKINVNGAEVGLMIKERFSFIYAGSAALSDFCTASATKGTRLTQVE